MAERLSSTYRLLCEVRLLHHYWLDDGATVFDLINSAATRQERLLGYDRRPYLELAPTEATAQALKNLQAVYKDTPLGGLVAVPTQTVIPAAARFDFVVTIRNPAWLNFTALTLRPQRIVELVHPTEMHTYRFKEDVPVLSNLTGAARGVGSGKTLFLSREYPALGPADRVEALVADGGALKQLTGDQPGAPLQQLHAQASAMPVFVHQGDVPIITPPAGLAGAPARGILLGADIPDAVFALIQLAAIRPNDGDFSLVDGTGSPKKPHPIFQVRFKNRATIRRYFHKTTGAFITAETDPLPLTHRGNAGTRVQPSEGLVKAVTSGTKITQLVSEIYV